jgi:ubiquinone/menaquinone biosynthesis C-methylase UbiE
MTPKPRTIEDVKTYWNNRPCNIRHSPAEIGTKQYFDEVEQRKYFVEPHIPKFAQFDRWKGKNVLEIGCGIGTDTINFARAGANVTAVDISAESLNLAKKRAEIYGVSSSIKFLECNAEELDKVLPKCHYDLVYSFGVIHHSPNPSAVLRAVTSLIREDGDLKLMVYNLLSWKAVYICFTYGKMRFWKIREFIPRYSEAEEGCPITFAYTKNEAKRLVESEGFQVNNTYIDHIFPYQIPQYVKYQYEKTRLIKVMPPSIFRKLEKVMGWHIMIEATLKKVN